MPATKEKLKLQDRPPQWQGFCSDGYGIRGGRIYFEPNKPNQHDTYRRELDIIQFAIDDAVDQEIDSGIVPGLSRIGSVEDSKFQEVKNALLRLPRNLLKGVCTTNKKIKIKPGETIDHWYHGPVLGVASSTEAIVAGDGPRIGQTALHEFFHLLDSLKKYSGISRSAQWLKIWNVEKYCDGWPLLTKKEPAEMLAEAGALYFYDESTRAKLSPAIKIFMGDLQNRF